MTQLYFLVKRALKGNYSLSFKSRALIQAPYKISLNSI